MSEVLEDIKNELGAFAGQYAPKIIKPATVTAVNADDTVAIEFSNGKTVDDARLKAVIKDGNKVLLIPKVNSTVLVGKIENSDEYVVLVVDEITELKAVIDTTVYSINTNGFLFKKGADTLLQALILFVEAIEPIIIIEGRNPDRVKLAQAKTKLNNLLR